MTRLTKTLREQICDNAIKKAPLQTKIRRLEKARVAFALAEAKAYITTPVIEQLKEIEKYVIAKKQKLTESGTILLNFSLSRRNYFTTTIGKKRLRFATEEMHLILYGNELKENSTKAKKLLKFEKDLKSLHEKRKDLRGSINRLLNSVTTIKRLLEVWPEANELLTKHEKPQTKTSLTIDIKSINKECALPTKSTK